MNFSLRFPIEIIFGRDSVNQIGKKTKEYGSKVFLVTGKSAMKKSGVTDKIIKSLKEAGIENIYIYDQAEHDPSVQTVDCGVKLAKEGGYEVVIGVGGGSAMDTAKTIASLVKNEGSALDYQSGKEIINQGLPFIAIPTTAGTGAEITNNSVITDTENKIKQSIRSPFMIAKVAIVDPMLTVSMPPKVTAASGMDALTQAIENYVSLMTNPFSDTLALRATTLISANLINAVKNGNDLDARENMALGSLFGAMAFANGKLGAVHGLAHPIGVLFDVPHGVICALLLPYVMEFNLSVRLSRYAEIAKAMGLGCGSDDEMANKAISEVRKMLVEMGLPQRLGEFGIKKDNIPLIIKSARGSSLDNNPRPATFEGLQEILTLAL